MELLISLLIFALVASLVYWVITQLPMPAPFRSIILVILVIIFIIYLLGHLSGGRVAF